jgi:hypothetical protein
MDVIINGNDMGFKAVYYLTDDNGRLINTPTFLEKYDGTLTVIWISVAAILFAYCIITWAVLKYRLRYAIMLKKNIYRIFHNKIDKELSHHRGLLTIVDFTQVSTW